MIQVCHYFKMFLVDPFLITRVFFMVLNISEVSSSISLEGNPCPGFSTINYILSTSSLFSVHIFKKSSFDFKNSNWFEISSSVKSSYSKNPVGFSYSFVFAYPKKIN